MVANLPTKVPADLSGAATQSTRDHPSGVRPDRPSRRDRLQDEFRALLDDVDPDELPLLGAAHTDADDRAAHEQVWGPNPTPGELAQAQLDNLRLHARARRDVVSHSVSTGYAAQLLGVSEQAITTKLREHQLVGIRVARAWRIPAWQFNLAAATPVVDGIPQLLAAFSGRVVSLSQWAQRPHVDLGGRTAARALADGDVEPVVHLAENLTAAGW